MNIIFLGTPDFAVPSIKAIYESHHKILAAVTQPDKPVGRKGELVFSPVKKFATEHGIKVLQYNKIRTEGVDDLRTLNADIMVTCAFGQILSQEIIDIAPHGIINVHASLLPKYRGAAPIQWAIINGDKETGVTIMKTEAGIDTGDVIIYKKAPIGERETSGELFDRLSHLGAELIVKALDLIEVGEATFTKQDDRFMSHVKMLKKEDGIIDFNSNSEKVVNFVRGMNPWPCAYTFCNGKMLKVFKAEKADAESALSFGQCGDIIRADPRHGLCVKTADGAVRLCDVQCEGKKRMSDVAFVVGHRITVGDKTKDNG